MGTLTFLGAVGDGVTFCDGGEEVDGDPQSVTSPHHSSGGGVHDAHHFMGVPGPKTRTLQDREVVFFFLIVVVCERAPEQVQDVPEEELHAHDGFALNLVQVDEHDQEEVLLENLDKTSTFTLLSERVTPHPHRIARTWTRRGSSLALSSRSAMWKISKTESSWQRLMTKPTE